MEFLIILQLDTYSHINKYLCKTIVKQRNVKIHIYVDIHIFQVKKPQNT